MSRSTFRPALGLLLSLVASAAIAQAADKTPQSSREEQRARESVQAALTAEASGDNTRRTEHLKSATEYSPGLAEANWHLGRVQVTGKWQSSAAAQLQAASDPRFAEYRELRAAAEGNTRLIRNLARWCLKQDLEDVARVHFTQLLARQDADAEMREEAVRRLDLHYTNGKWMTGKEIAEQQYKTQVIEDSLAKWRPRLKKLQVSIDGTDGRLQEKAIEELRRLDQPQIIPALESFLVDGGDRFQEEAVRQLAKFRQYEATEAVARFAVLSPYVGARDLAIGTLRNRPVFEYCPMLLTGLNAPFESQFQISKDQSGRIIYVQAIHRQNANVSQTTVARTASVPLRVDTGVRMRVGFEQELQRQFQQLEMNRLKEMAADVNLRTRMTNAVYDNSNRQITTVLAGATGIQCGNEPADWWEWWQDYNQKWWPQYSEFACSEYQRTYELPVARHSCFVAGTPVQTQTGPAAIDTVQVGDRVLSQDQETGELTYKVVQQTTVRPPAKILLVRIGDEEIRTTLGHPFWVNGEGWKLAKDLKAGEYLHSLHGALKIDSVEPLPKEEQAHNLVVDDFNTYFVGQTSLLVHDNEFRKPTRAIVPGLIANAALAATK